MVNGRLREIMKNTLVTILILFSISGTAQQRAQPVSRLVKEILKTYRKLFEFDNTYDGLKENVGDSIDKYNSALISLISAPAFGVLKDSDYNSISKSTDIAIQFSQDKKLMVVSWRVLYNIPNQECINILWIGGKATSANAMKVDTEEEFANNVQVEKIVDFNLRGRVYYLLMGSKRIGNLDILEMISAFYITNNDKFNPASIFYDGKKYYQELGFDYILNVDIKEEPSFLIKGDELTCPTFNEYRTIVTGSKRYKIKPAGLSKQ
jgi:hypothetical protein